MSVSSLSTPPLWQTFQLVLNPIRFFEKSSRRYGDIFSTRVLGLDSPPVVFVSHPEAVKQVFTAPGGTFALGKVTDVFRPLTGPQSLIMLDGASHLRQRKLLMPPLHGQSLQSYGQTIQDITLDTLSRLPKKRVFRLRPYLAEITLDIILRVVFGIGRGQRYERLKGLISQLLEEITQPLYSTCFFFPPLQKDLGVWSPWGHFLQQQREIDELIYQEIRERRQQQEDLGMDVLSLLLRAEDEAGQGMTDEELRDQLITLLLLGHETTASALDWAFYWIYSQDVVLSRLEQELNTVGTQAAPHELCQLPYLQAVCQETLRTYPIAIIAQPRVLQEDYTIHNYLLTKDTIVVPNIYLAHHREGTFQQSDQFNPDRFLNRTFTAYEFFPFGGGSRSCIGAAFALFEMQVILGTMVAETRFQLQNRLPAKPVRRGITFVPSGGCRMIQ
ncbi:cytochrome P450 [Spirulina sp. CS-785/01]|uniref:cytochrome P450 n=1 Tax=Spirulina sp. CS-785/01 TaxID=3021716 RepID=UPI00232DA75E|nr:cytochrome P450 [Spirulina sp. CS-785/01]MDB9313730.1 cytochrome P450 [Spirulina sp. CS-785/01]